ncbi:MAG: SLC13 family permease, partial [Candidatus Xenobia bacterium]
MTIPQVEVLILSVGAAATMLSGRGRVDLVAAVTLALLGILRLEPPERLFSGFANSAVITIVGLFVITRALEQTGVGEWLADLLAPLGGGSEARTVVVFMTAGALLSLFMNNIAAGAVLLPAALAACRRVQIPPGRLLMPVAFGTLLGGMATLFTTANLVLSGALVGSGHPALRMMDFLPLGGLITAVGIVYMALIGTKLLNGHGEALPAAPPDLETVYGLPERLWEGHLRRDLRHLDWGERLGISLVAVEREGHWRLAQGDIALAQDDSVLVLGRQERVEVLQQEGMHVRPMSPRVLEKLGMSVREMVVPPRSPVVGQTLAQVDLPRVCGLTALAMWRDGRSYRTD